MEKLSRRNFFRVSGAASATVIAPVAMAMATPGQAQASSPLNTGTVLPYHAQKVAEIKNLKVNTPVAFNYPDKRSPCVLVKLGTPVKGGVGPDKDIVAFSTLCTHMGCPMPYEPSEKVFKCACHFSIFDAEKDGQVVIGQATEKLPRILLDYNVADGSVSAHAVQGLLYGRQSNFVEL